MDRSTPKPTYWQRGSADGQSAFESHSALQYSAVLAPLTHSALKQSASPVHVTPTPPSPRAPGLHHTLVPLLSSLTQVKPGPQSSDEKQGQSVFTAQLPPSQWRYQEPPSG
jgi:hypothetical protein